MIKKWIGFTQTETEALQSRENTAQGDYQITKMSGVARRTAMHCFSEKEGSKRPPVEIIKPWD